MREKHYSAGLVNSNLTVDNESGAGIPLIDLKKLNGPERPKVVEAIGRACESDGFFMVRTDRNGPRRSDEPYGTN